MVSPDTQRVQQPSGELFFSAVISAQYGPGAAVYGKGIFAGHVKVAILCLLKNISSSRKGNRYYPNKSERLVWDTGYGVELP